ncbi:MAG TPA: DUF885 family protein [Gemmataceae bacterium]|nr:DUF885 family protein [Gemmataceae bacterium]
MKTSQRMLATLLLIGVGGPALAQEKEPAIPDLRELVSRPQSEMRVVVERYEADRGSLNRFYTIPSSPTRHARLKRFYADWLAALQKLDADRLSPEGREDYRRLYDGIRRELRQLEQQARSQAEIAPLVPFAPTIINLEEARRRMEKVDAFKAAGVLNDMKKQIVQTRSAVEAALKSGEGVSGVKITKDTAGRAVRTIDSLRTALRNWFNFYNGYDPIFTWWMGEPYKEADAALQGYVALLREKTGSEEASEDRADPAPGELEEVPEQPVPPPRESEVPDLNELLSFPRSEMRGVIQRYQADRGGSGRFRGAAVPLPAAPPSPERIARSKKLYAGWLAALGQLDFESLSPDGRIDYLLLKNHIERELRRLELQARTQQEAARFVPFESSLLDLDRARRAKERVEPARAADLLTEIKKQIEQARRATEDELKAVAGAASVRVGAASAAETINRLRTALKEWFDYSSSADPQFAEPVGEPYREVNQALESYASFLREKVAGLRRDDSGITGRPIGREALLVELAGEMIPYTPEELIAIAHKEFAWCEREMKKASRDLGFGDDWQKAVERVKTLHVEPGRQPELIRDLAWEAIDYLRKHDLVTVPPLARETWRMEMMSPQRQLINPFFTGGETISVSYPTNTMSHEAKLQSMRGNNIHFARATVHHELIPGHHLQGFMTARYRPYRGLFSTPFWGEGWALYWEMVLYDMGFPRTPEDRVGFLFWRMHRCARIIFSLNFHLGKMTPQECIDFLVERVGHERDNATAEVRRSFAGGYGPLYQAAYMLGGLQLRALRRELVDSGKMVERDFHDAILRENRIPIAMVRASLLRQPLSRDYAPNWRFYSDLPAGW